MGQQYIAVTSSSGFSSEPISGLSISATTYTPPATGSEVGSIVFGFSGLPTLSSVVVGSQLNAFLCEDEENVGVFDITAVNDGSDTITVAATHGLTNASSSGGASVSPLRIATRIICTEDTTGLSIKDEKGDTIDIGELSATAEIEGLFSEVTIGTSGTVLVYPL